MSKILTDYELGEIIVKAIKDENFIDDAKLYEQFIRDLGSLVCNYFGGEPKSVYSPDDTMSEWTIAIGFNDCVPEDGGIWNDYDKDVIWSNGEEK